MALWRCAACKTRAKGVGMPVSATARAHALTCVHVHVNTLCSVLRRAVPRALVLGWCLVLGACASGYAHQARGFYSQMIVGSSFNASTYSDGRWNIQGGGGFSAATDTKAAFHGVRRVNCRQGRSWFSGCLVSVPPRYHPAMPRARSPLRNAW